MPPRHCWWWPSRAEIREPGGLREKNLVPKKYADFKKSGIEIKVEEDDNDVGVIELVD